MLHSNFEKVVQEVIDKEDIDINIDVSDKFKDFVRGVESELDREVNNILDHLKSKISDMDSRFKLNLDDKRDHIYNQVKENLLKS